MAGLGLAHIAPFEMLPQSSFSKYQMMLAPLVEHPAYAQHYLRMCELPEKHVILDNGAAEGVRMPDRRLLEIAKRFLPTELVIPDAMGDANKTFSYAWHFMGEVQKQGCQDDFMFGYVLQSSKGVASAYRHLERVLSEPWSNFISVWYIPRVLTRTAQDRYARLELAGYISGKDQHRRPIHLLGMQQDFPQEIRAIVTAMSALPQGHGSIRSLDTSLPYVYAMAGRYIERDTNPHLSREEGYFEATVPASTRLMAIENCRTLERWAQGQ